MTDAAGDDVVSTISVVVPTMGRPDHAAECVASILACDDPAFTVTVIDQSADDLTEASLERLADDRVSYVHTTERGAANARNRGVVETDGSVVAFTDDDCRVDRNWIGALRAAFADPTVGMVFGGVVMGATDDPDAHAAEFLPDRDVTYSSLPPVSEPWGISASMAIRRSVFGEVGGFDTQLGPGAAIHTGGEDSDLFIRVLAARHRVAATNATTITHLGFRSGDDARALYRGYAFALGAVFMKHLRLRTKPGREQLPKWVFHFARQTAGNLVRSRTTTGAGFTIGLCRGAWHAVRRPVDPTTSRFGTDTATGR